MDTKYMWVDTEQCCNVRLLVMYIKAVINNIIDG